MFAEENFGIPVTSLDFSGKVEKRKTLFSSLSFESVSLIEIYLLSVTFQLFPFVCLLIEEILSQASEMC